MEFIATNVGDLNEIAKKILTQFPTERIFAFFGEMGAGKTTLIKELCSVLGSTNNICSPTFAIVNEYKAKENKIFHFDFYRIEKPEEAFEIGYEEYFYSGEYCFIEWSEKIEPLLPENYVRINIDIVDKSTRKITACSI